MAVIKYKNPQTGEETTIPLAVGGASSWDKIQNKPFESIDNDTLIVEDGVLSATAKGGASSWNDLTDKPFENIDNETLVVDEDGTLSAVGGGDLPNNITYFDDTEEETEIPTIPQLDDMSPIGTIISYMGTKAPDDFLICDGTIYDISKYRKLANHFKDQFGSYNFFGGDGETTFAVPDLQGEFLRGSGTNSHANQGKGADVGIHQDATNHPRLLTYDRSFFNFRTGSGASGYPQNADTSHTRETNRVQVDGYQASTSGETSWFTSRPTNTSVLYCIKCEDNVTKIINYHIYSTEEKVVGEWIDHKPLYERTLNVNFTGNPPYSTEINVSDINIEHYHLVNGEFKNPTRSWPFNFFELRNEILGRMIIVLKKDTKTILVQSNITGITISNVEFTIQYTKTTDTPNN